MSELGGMVLVVINIKKQGRGGGVGVSDFGNFGLFRSFSVFFRVLPCFYWAFHLIFI